MERNGPTIYESERCRVGSSLFSGLPRKGNTLYMHVHHWPGETVSLGGLRNKVLPARLFASGKSVTLVQEDWRVKFTGLPQAAPGTPVTVLAIERDGEPRQDMNLVRREPTPTEA